MASVGSAAAGKTLIGTGNGASPTFASIGTNSGLTSRGVLIAEGNGAFQATSAGSIGQVLQSQGALADPTYSSATYPSSVNQGDLLYASAANSIQSLVKNTTATRYLANTGASNAPNWDQVNAANGITGLLPVANGGLASTGLTGFVAGTGSAYNGRTLAAGTGITISNTQGVAGNPGFNVIGGGVTWNSVTGVSQTPSTGNGYYANNAGSRIDFNIGGLSQGDYYRIVGVAAGGWRLNANGSSKVIRILSSACTPGTGYIESTTQYDCVEVVVFSSTLVLVISSMGNITVV